MTPKNSIKEFSITPLSEQFFSDDALFAIVEANCEKLRSLGLGINATVQKVQSGQIQLSITRDSITYANGTFPLSAENVISLSRFTERASVQGALNDMSMRMINLGWKVTITPATMLDDEEIKVERSDGETDTYSPTNAEMVRLRRDLDVAETHWIVGGNMPLFLKVGWQVLKSADGDCYVLYKPNGLFDTIPFGRIDQAKYCVKQAQEALDGGKASETAKKLGSY